MYKQLGMKTSETNMVPLFREPAASEKVPEKEDRKVPMTPGVKETPKGTCHLHFLLSPFLRKNCRKCCLHPSWTSVFVPWGSHLF